MQPERLTSQGHLSEPRFTNELGTVRQKSNTPYLRRICVPASGYKGISLLYQDRVVVVCLISVVDWILQIRNVTRTLSTLVHHT